MEHLVTSPADRYWPIAQLAELLNGQVFGDPQYPIVELHSLKQATERSIAYVKDASFLDDAQQSPAGCLVVSADLVNALPDRNLIVVDVPYVAFAKLSHVFDQPLPAAGVHPTAQIAASAIISPDASVGAFCVIGESVHIGAGSVLGAHCVLDQGVTLGNQCFLEAHVAIGRHCQLGDRVRIHANTTIGSEGFGFAPYAGRWERIAQLGRVQIGHDVRIGANCTIDRGALDDTVIGNGVIIDNLVQVAHNVRIGDHTAIAAKCGIAGSTQIGQHCILGGACGVAGHLVITDHVQFTGMSMVTRSIHQPGVYSSGTGIMPNADWKKAIVSLRHMASQPFKTMMQTLQRLEQRLQQLEQQVDPRPELKPGVDQKPPVPSGSTFPFTHSSPDSDQHDR